MSREGAGVVKKVCGPDGGGVIKRLSGRSVTYGFTGTPRTRRTPPEDSTGDTAPVNPHHRHISAFAHDTAGTSGPGNPRRSVGRSSHTPRDGRYGGRTGRPGTLPPVPGRLTRLWGLGALFSLGVALFAVLTWQVTSGGALVGTDGRVLRVFRRAAAAHPGWTTTAHYLCKLGNIQAAVPVLLAAVCLTAWLGRRAALPRWWLPPLAAALAMAVVPVVVSLVKSAVVRPAPGRIHPRADGYGYFPSGHTATSAMAFGAATLLVLPFVRRVAGRIALAAATALLLLAVGAALVWCDYHWPLDVLASWALTLTLLSAVAAARLLSERAAAAANCSSGSRGSDPRDSDRASAG